MAFVHRHLRGLDQLLDLSMSDKTASWWLKADGAWTQLYKAAWTQLYKAEDGTPVQGMQNVLMKQIPKRKRALR